MQKNVYLCGKISQTSAILVHLYTFKDIKSMKKLILLAFVAASMTAFAQHVTPLNIQIADVKLDSLRQRYIAEPTMYRASLDVVAQNLAKNADEIKAAKAQLKVENEHAKQRANSLKEASKMTASLKKAYASEESDLKSMQKVVDKQQKNISKQTELNEATRESYQKFLEQQSRELNAALRDVANRQHAIADLETAIKSGETALATFTQEIQQKNADLAGLEALHKERSSLLKAEQKAAKALQ